MEKNFDCIKLIGTLAVEKGWVSNEDVKLALANQKTGNFFGEILLKKQLISTQQLEELLKLQQESEIRKEDFLFGQIAVHNRFLKAQDVINALEEQKNKNSKDSLGEILKKKKLLNDQQCSAILTSQKRIGKTAKSQNKKIACPKCETFYQIKDSEKYRKVRCKNCQYVFEVGKPNVEVIFDTIQPNTGTKENIEDIESKSLNQFLKENDLSPKANLSDSTDILFKTEGRYEIGKEIARGGMGSILMTKDVNLRRNIVTKVLLNKKSKLGTLRFIEEAQITGQLEHPNIPPVYDLGVNKKNNIFFTMKHIKGVTLENIIKKLQKKDPLTIEQYNFKTITNIFIKVCNALEYAHSKKVIHRDIKPDNIMIGEYGEVLLMDWGLAKIMGTAEEIEDLEGDRISSVRSQDESSNTIEGTTAGTPVFMSPEQAMGHLEELDQRADIYSLGATLYSVLALDRPIKGKSIHDILLNAADGKIEEIKRPVPPELKAITLKAMAFKPNDRYQTIKEIENDLLNYQLGYSVSAKQDNLLDIVRKFYLRNKMLSIFSAAFLFVFLAGSLLFVTSLRSQRNIAVAQRKIADEALIKTDLALAKAEEALKQYEQEKVKRMSDNKSSAPSLYAKAQDEAQSNNFKEAEKLMDTVIIYDNANQDYRLFRGCLAFTNNNFSKAKLDLGGIKNHTFQKNIAELLDILNTPNLKEFSETQKASIAEICTNMKLFDIAQKQMSDVTKKLNAWNQKLRNAWGGANYGLDLINNKLTFNSSNPNISDYSALKGIPIKSLNFMGCKLSDISFIENMPLEELEIHACPVTDLSVLKNKKLKVLKLENVNVKDLNALANSELNTLLLRGLPIKTLKPILQQPIKDIDFFDLKLDDITELKAFTLEKIALCFCKIENLDFVNMSQLKYFQVNSLKITELSKLKDAPLLEGLDISGTACKDISPIQNKNIKLLIFGNCGIENLDTLLTLKNLDTLIVVPSRLPPNWETIILKMKPQLKLVGIGVGDYLKPVDQFIAEFKGINITNKKK